jgi:hypothetical protein
VFVVLEVFVLVEVASDVSNSIVPFVELVLFAIGRQQTPPQQAGFMPVPKNVLNLILPVL